MDANPAPNSCRMRSASVSDTTQCSCLPMTVMKTCGAHAVTQPLSLLLICIMTWPSKMTPHSPGASGHQHVA